MAKKKEKPKEKKKEVTERELKKMGAKEGSTLHGTGKTLRERKEMMRKYLKDL